MPVSKLKNLAILILLLANLALLSLVVPTRLARSQQSQLLRQELQALCSQQQVELSDGAIADTVTLYTLELGEDSQADLQAATALLGAQVLVQDDSTRYFSTYRSSLGTCAIGRSGSFQAQLTGQSSCDDLQSHAEATLAAMGFAIDRHGNPMLRSDGSTTISAIQSVLGVPVFTQGLTLTYENQCLTAVDGVFFTGAGTVTRVDTQACMSAADALVQFLSARYELGWVGSTVISMEQGYRQADTASAAVVHLTPVWHLQTYTGSFYIDGISGSVSAAE